MRSVRTRTASAANAPDLSSIMMMMMMMTVMMMTMTVMTIIVPGLFYIIVEKWLVVIIGGRVGVHDITWYRK